MQNVVGLTLVAMATKFVLGAEIRSPTGFFIICLFYFIEGQQLSKMHLRCEML